MPRTLESEFGAVIMSNRAWGFIMKLAHTYGWEPAGTEEPDEWTEQPLPGPDGGWNTSDYFTNQGQRVLDDDAAAIADALERALPDIPDHDALSHKVEAVEEVEIQGAYGEVRRLRVGETVNEFELFSGENKAKLRRFIDFCRASGFAIK